MTLRDIDPLVAREPAAREHLRNTTVQSIDRDKNGRVWVYYTRDGEAYTLLLDLFFAAPEAAQIRALMGWPA